MASDVGSTLSSVAADAVARAFISVRQAADWAHQMRVQSERAAAKDVLAPPVLPSVGILAAKRATEREAERARRAEVARERR